MDEFWFFGQNKERNLVSCKRINVPFAPVYFKDELRLPSSPRFTLEEIPTPLFESIYTPQKWSKEMVDWMFVFLGRLFYAVGEKDDWQVIPFLLT